MTNKTVKEIEEVQNQQLREWKQLLNAEVYNALAIRTRRDNHLATCGDDLFRGSSMSNFVQNYLRYVRLGELEKELGLRGFELFESLMTAK